jgi:regulator of protease activity HflC (stomatin/prohibitin superfamily)
MSMLLSPFVMVKQNHIVIIERLGRYAKSMEPGLNFKIPLLDQVAYQHNLKEQVIDIEHQQAITRDNVKIEINGVLYYKIVDAWKASYNIAGPTSAMTMLVQTTMRSEIGRLELDRTFEERDLLNTNIKNALQNATESWGLEVLRYEIKDIKPPAEIRRSMEFQSESERIKRSKILASEGER